MCSRECLRRLVLWLLRVWAELKSTGLEAPYGNHYHAGERNNWSGSGWGACRRCFYLARMRLLSIANRIRTTMGTGEDLRTVHWQPSALSSLPRWSFRRRRIKLLGKTRDGTGNRPDCSNCRPRPCERRRASRACLDNWSFRSFYASRS